MKNVLLFYLLLTPFLLQAQEEWEITLPELNSYHSFISEIITTSDGGYLAVRQVWTESGGDDSYFTVIKLNDAGIVEWEEPFELEAYNWRSIADVIEEQDGGFTLLMSQYELNYLIKINEEGEFISTDTLQNSTNFLYNKLERIPSGYRLFGMVWWNATLDWEARICDYSDSLILSTERPFPVLASPNSSSTNTFPASIVDFEHTDDGGYILAINNNFPFDDTQYYGYAMKLDSNLEVEWHNNTDESDNDQHSFSGVEILDNGDYFFAGAFSFAAYTAQFSPGGELINSGIESSSYFADVDRNDQGDVLMVGSRVEFAPMNPFKASLGFLHENELALYEQSSIPYDHGYAVVGDAGCFVIGGIKDNKAYLSKQCNLINSAVEVPDDAFLNVSPNPSNGVFSIQNAMDYKQVKVFNQLGMLVFEKEITVTDEIDLSAYSSGVYFLQLNDGAEELKTIKIVLAK